MTTTRYTKEHEWITVDAPTAGAIATVGITNFAQNQLGEIVFVDLPPVGQDLVQGGEAAVVESVKAASDVYAPLDGTVVEVNSVLNDEPAKVNDDAEGEGWFFRMRIADPAQLESLMDAEAYGAYKAAHGGEA